MSARPPLVGIPIYSNIVDFDMTLTGKLALCQHLCDWQTYLAHRHPRGRLGQARG